MNPESTSSATRYPLSWPTGWKRTPARERKPTTFTESKAGTAAAPTKRIVPVSFVTARDPLWAQLGHLGV